jgi:hypothetical protein
MYVYIKGDFSIFSRGSNQTPFLESIEVGQPDVASKAFMQMPFDEYQPEGQ